MAKKKTVVITNNKEIYKKFNLLHFSSEILLENVKPIQVQRIIKNINKNDICLSTEILGDYILVKKIKPINFNIYLR